MTAKIYHADLYGTRLHKYKTLLGSDMESVDWQELSPNVPFYLFMPQEQAYREEYEAGWTVTDIFPLNNVGITTARDALTIQFTEEEIKKVVNDFKGLPVEVAREKYHLGLDARDWKIDLAQEDLRTSKGDYLPVLYRPFDKRFTYYTGVSRGFQCMPRGELMRQMLAKNIGLGTVRGIEAGGKFEHIFVTSSLFTHHTVSIKEVNYLFPLYIYPTEKEAALGMEREANINPKFLAEVKERTGETPAPEDIFHYAYAVFHAPTYRARYAAFLKTDFPRLPLPPDAEIFDALAALGAKLVALHLLEDPALQKHGIAYPVGGSHEVKKMRQADRYQEPTPARLGSPPLPVREGLSETLLAPPSLTGKGAGGLGSSEAGGSAGRVRLNDTEYFDNVPPAAWEFRVGGYQPAAKWLDDRAGRTLTEADITHYRRMIAALRETAALLPQVDAAFLQLLAANTESAAGEPGAE